MRDIDIRRALRQEMNRLHGADPNTRTIEELGLCQGTVRVDMAVVNGKIHGYEIKSEQDTLARLPGQCAVYNQVLDLVTIVTATSHAARLSGLIPRWWGIWKVVDKETTRLEEIRAPRKNPAVSIFAQVQLLWKEEALAALESRGLADGIRAKPRRELWNRLAVELSREEVATLVRECIKKRPGWRADAPPL
jgi:hypothetical protein